MNILYYSAHPDLNLNDPAGYGTHMREMISAFKKLGHEVNPLIIGGIEPREKIDKAGPSIIKKLMKTLVPTVIWETAKDHLIFKNDKDSIVSIDLKYFK